MIFLTDKKLNVRPWKQKIIVSGQKKIEKWPGHQGFDCRIKRVCMTHGCSLSIFKVYKPLEKAGLTGRRYIHKLNIWIDTPKTKHSPGWFNFSRRFIWWKYLDLGKVAGTGPQLKWNLQFENKFKDLIENAKKKI